MVNQKLADDALLRENVVCLETWHPLPATCQIAPEEHLHTVGGTSSMKGSLL